MPKEEQVPFITLRNDLESKVDLIDLGTSFVLRLIYLPFNAGPHQHLIALTNEEAETVRAYITASRRNEKKGDITVN